MKQADEIFSKDDVATEGLSHPETFIRARALALWHSPREQAHPCISKMIEGKESLSSLDLIGQTRMVKHTRRLLECFLQPKWFQTSAVLGHAKLFFHDFQPATTKDLAALEVFKTGDAKLREYLFYVLLDFVAADPELDASASHLGDWQ